MPHALTFSLALLLLPVAASAAIERVVEKSFQVSPDGALRVETHGGGIRITTAEGNEVRVVARQRIRADSDAEADELLRKLELTMEQKGSEVHVSARYPSRPSGWRFFSWPPVQVEFDIAVPPAFAADLRTSGGGIKVGDLQGPLVARTSGGDIQLGRLGGTVEAKTSGGSIKLAGARGKTELHTSGGNITAGELAGPANLSTSGGNIRFDSASGVVTARTSGGDIRAAIAGELSDDSSLTTSGGNVEVTVDPGARFNLHASTSGGGVALAGLAVAFEKNSRTRVVGAVNGGGRLLTLRTSGGNVRVQAN